MKKRYLRLLILLFPIILTNLSSAQNQKFRLNLPNFKSQKTRIRTFKIDYRKLPDDSIKKFVGVNKPFDNKNYKPYDLVSLKGRSHIQAQSKHTLRKEAADNLEKMADAFYSEFGTNILIVSSYRSYSYQKNSISKNCKQSGRCAKEGESEHQLGLAVDLRETTNEKKFLSKYQKYYNRLNNNAHLYGFHQSYKNGKEIDGYYTEPRHRRYLGVELATKLHENNITFTQYVKSTT